MRQAEATVMRQAVISRPATTHARQTRQTTRPRCDVFLTLYVYSCYLRNLHVFLFYFLMTFCTRAGLLIKEQCGRLLWMNISIYCFIIY
jgi:hypothetical protein